MHYDNEAQWRPLFETDMIPLQVTSGCSHNSCKFCDMYHRPFSVCPQEQVEADIAEIGKFYLYPRRIFLEAGNAFTLSADKLISILERIREDVGEKTSVGCFARITDVARKTDDELARMVQLGLSDISIGAESGYDPALSYMNKGYTAQDIVEQCARLDRAGLTYSLFYLIGMAGKGHCIDAARATVEVFDKTHPQCIMVHTMTPFAGTPLAAEIADGTFKQALEREVIEELREFVAKTQLDTYLLAQHYANVVRFGGRVPANRDEIIRFIDETLEQLDEKTMERFRGRIKSI